MKLKKEIKKFLEKFWFIVWKDDSLKGWIISLIFLFVVIKFIFFPSMSLITGTELPLAIVESCSMYHQGNLLSDFDDWWNQSENKYSEFEIDKQEFKEFIFKKGFNKGDILFIIKAKPEKLKVGDVIIFNGNVQHPIIHRIVEIKEENGKKVFSTIGDNIETNKEQIPFEKEIKSNQLVGKAVFKLAPYVGWGKLIGADIWYKIFPGDSNYISEGFC